MLTIIYDCRAIILFLYLIDFIFHDHNISFFSSFRGQVVSTIITKVSDGRNQYPISSSRSRDLARLTGSRSLRSLRRHRGKQTRWNNAENMLR